MREKIVKDITNEENTWREVFKNMNIEVPDETSAELEFRKAIYKHKFDRQWYSEITKIENDHYAVMGAILAFTKTTSPEALKENPLESPLKSVEYKYEVDIPFVRELSDELMMMLGQKFRFNFARVQNESEVKHQRLLDSVQASINSSMYKGYKNNMPAPGSRTGKSIRSYLSKESGKGSTRRNN